MKQKIFWSIITAILLLLTGCAKPRPDNVENICSIFSQYPEWYWYAKEVEQKWAVPVPLVMAIINQESSFDAHAKPPRKKLLWIIPWKRISSSYGYSQALDGTWEHYERHTGNRGKRHKFDDTCDFIGWYCRQAQSNLKIAPTNGYALYLAYHDGMGGYAKRTYLKKPWLIRTAHKVNNRAALYKRQLTSCEHKIPR